MTIIIREGSGEDDEVCGKIIGASSGSAIYMDRLPHAKTLFTDTSPLPLEGRLRLVAEKDGDAIGFADYTAAKGHVKYLFVDPERQGGGAGAALLDAVQERTGGPISVHVLALNDTGILWYLKRGFKVVDGWSELLEGVDAAWIRMVRDPS